MIIETKRKRKNILGILWICVLVDLEDDYVY
jgi:hypothetical protein